MIDFNRLTVRGQVGRLRTLAECALQAYPLAAPKLEFIDHGENTTFKATDERLPGGSRHSEDSVPGRAGRTTPANRYLVRVHRTGYHDESQVRSELMWLEALTAAGIPAPKPLHTITGEPLVTASAPGVPEPRMCSLLHWSDGRFVRSPRPVHFYRLGRLMARLHEHAVTWRPSDGFSRRRWDWEGLFGVDSGFDVSPEEVWDNLPEEARKPVRRAADAAARAMDALGTGNDAYGLIHADLHFGNVLFAGDEILPIDFDDCGYALLIYDIAVPLADYLDEPEWETRRDSLLDGYRSIRPYPAGMEQLPVIMAARHATLLLWAIDRARTNEQFRKYLPTWTEWNCGSIEKAFAL